ncbi:hypothetical protein D3C84_930500 [compost metagenome]
MQIREKGNRYSFIRTTYNKDKGRGENEQIGSASVEDFSVEMRDGYSFTEAEQAQWSDFKRSAQFARVTDAQSGALTGAPGAIASATKAIDFFKYGGSPLNEQLAGDIWAAMAELQQALKKAGFKRPKKDDKAPAESV